MSTDTFLTVKKSILLLLLYFFPPGLLLFLTGTLPQLFGASPSELHFDIISIIAASVGLLPVIIYIERKTKILGNCKFTLPSIKIVFIAFALTALTFIVTIPFNNPRVFYNEITSGRIIFLIWETTQITGNNLIMMIGTLLLAPIAEEVLFRKQLIEILLGKYSPIKAILISSFIFALVHLRINDFFSLFIWGSLFGYIYFRTRSLGISIILHSCSNFFTYITGIKSYGIDVIFVIGYLTVFILYIFIIYYILRHLKRFSPKDFNSGIVSL